MMVTEMMKKLSNHRINRESWGVQRFMQETDGKEDIRCCAPDPNWKTWRPESQQQRGVWWDAEEALWGRDGLTAKKKTQTTDQIWQSAAREAKTVNAPIAPRCRKDQQTFKEP